MQVGDLIIREKFDSVLNRVNVIATRRPEVDPEFGTVV